MSKPNLPSVNDELIFRPGEHQVWLSFVNDDEAVSFYEWWHSKGSELWQKHYVARESKEGACK